MRPKADRHEAKPEEQLPAVQEDETRNTPYDALTEHFIRQVSSQLRQTLAQLEGTKKSTLSELDEKVEGIVYEATPESRDEVRKALKVMQDVTKQYIEAVAEEAIAASRSDSQVFQDILIEMDAEITDRHATAMAALEAKLDKAQETDAVSGEPITKPQAGREGRGASNMSSRTSNSASSVEGFEELFGGSNRPRRTAGQSSHRPPKPTARGSFKSSQSQNKNRTSLWDRGGKRQDSVDSAEIGSESRPKTDVLLEPKDLKSTDYEDLDPMMRSLLEAGEDLHQEFKKDASKAGTEEWQGETEYADLQEQLNQVLLQYNKQKGMVMQKNRLIDGLREEIAKLKTSNLDLTANLESMARAPSTGATNTPIANQFGHLRSVTSFPVNSAGGSPRTSNVAWISMWLPKAVRLQVERARVAIQRCVAEEASCSEKMLKLGGGKQTIKEKDCLTARQSSSEKHRQDFTLIMSFLDELSRHSKKSQSSLADELSGMESTDSIATLRKIPTPDSSNSDGQTPTGTEGSKKSAPESGYSVSQVRDASTSPKEPAGETHDSSTSPKNQGTTPKVPSPLAEPHTPPASNTTPPEGNAPPASNTAPPEGNNEQARELDDPANATLRAVEAIDSGVLGMWSFFAHVGLVAMTHAGAWVRVCKFIFQIFTYIMNQISRAVRLVWPFGHGADEESLAPRFPKLPSPGCFIVVMYYCAAFLTFQVYMASQRERNIWFEANGLTRKYMLERSRSESRWLIYGVDGNLVVGRKDIESFFKLIYMLAMTTLQHLYRLAYGTPRILELGQ
ncbi:hypothetical protein B0J15DRAFT_215392 [Fusarium solani]|uniref:Uncharacterized protein n=1 Tax=Fusarium solani TaxID=169388 RepID=A0A9P9R9K1_FUSSL|nr:uncharacterized protein B0J15DRAFT_215392 [Fusarium solani]KAH7271416.1 hypothetical protein B0J15DRAFT_215392 [Fusarium solani]